jgi:hypothetical protein
MHCSMAAHARSSASISYNSATLLVITYLEAREYEIFNTISEESSDLLTTCQV